MSNEEEFEESEIVWGKFKGYPWWPCIVLKLKNRETNEYICNFIGEKKSQVFTKEKLKKFGKHYNEYSNPLKGKKYQIKRVKKAIEIANAIKTEKITYERIDKFIKSGGFNLEKFNLNEWIGECCEKAKEPKLEQQDNSHYVKLLGNKRSRTASKTSKSTTKEFETKVKLEEPELDYKATDIKPTIHCESIYSEIESKLPLIEQYTEMYNNSFINLNNTCLILANLLSTCNKEISKDILFKILDNMSEVNKSFYNENEVVNNLISLVNKLQNEKEKSKTPTKPKNEKKEFIEDFQFISEESKYVALNKVFKDMYSNDNLFVSFPDEIEKLKSDKSFFQNFIKGNFLSQLIQAKQSIIKSTNRKIDEKRIKIKVNLKNLLLAVSIYFSI